MEWFAREMERITREMERITREIRQFLFSLALVNVEWATSFLIPR